MSSVEKILSNFLYEQVEPREIAGYPFYDRYIDDFPIVTIVNKSISSVPSTVLSGEKNSEYVTFQMNRYYDGIDLSTKLINICYTIDNTDIGGSDSPINVDEDGMVIKFGWLLPEAITMRECTVKFGILIIGKEYEKDYILKTKTAQFSIAKGFVCGSGIIKPDDNWFEQFFIRIDSYIQQKIQEIPGGGGEGTNNYNALFNKPLLNNVEIIGNKTPSNYGFHKVATSGSYNDLVNIPDPIKRTSQLTNDSGFIADPKYVHTDNNLTNDLKSDIEKNTTNRHNHANKVPLDKITQDLIDKWDTVDNKVDKIDGMGLSSNDYTDVEKDKLANLLPNVQADWDMNDTEDKSFIKNKPTKLSQFTNDLNFIDNTVNNLLNYYNKTEAYNKTEVNDLIGKASGIYLEMVETLPTENISQSVIYIVPRTKVEEKNNYDEYINISGAPSGWEKIGENAADLTNYYKKPEINDLLDNKVDKIIGMGLSSQDYTFTEKNQLEINTNTLEMMNNGFEIPIVSIIDDKGFMPSYTVFFEYMKTIDRLGSLSIMSDMTETSYMTQEQIIEMQEYGFDIMNHSFNDTAITKDNMETVIPQAIAKAVEKGYTSANNIFVYPDGTIASNVEEYCKGKFDYCLNIPDGTANTLPFNRGVVKRYFVSDLESNFETVKSDMDRLLVENTWLLLSTRSNEGIEILKQTIDYIIDKVQIMKVTEAVNYFKINIDQKLVNLGGGSGLDIEAALDKKVDKVNGVFDNIAKMTEGYYVHETHGTIGTLGYFHIATLEIQNTRANTPIILKVVQRTERQIELIIFFDNTNDLDPTLRVFDSVNEIAYIHKSAPSIWNLYIKKSEANDYLSINDFTFLRELNQKIKVTWKNEQIETLPDGYVESKITTQNINVTSANKFSTGRKINEVLFDGTKDITIVADPIGYKTITYSTTEPTTVGANEIVFVYE